MIAEPPPDPGSDQPDHEEGKDGMTAGLPANQEKAIVALLHEPTIAKAAESAGVGESPRFSPKRGASMGGAKKYSWVQPA